MNILIIHFLGKGYPWVIGLSPVHIQKKPVIVWSLPVIFHVSLYWLTLPHLLRALCLKSIIHSFPESCCVQFLLNEFEWMKIQKMNLSKKTDNTFQTNIQTFIFRLNVMMNNFSAASSVTFKGLTVESGGGTSSVSSNYCSSTCNGAWPLWCTKRTWLWGVTLVPVALALWVSSWYRLIPFSFPAWSWGLWGCCWFHLCLGLCLSMGARNVYPDSLSFCFSFQPLFHSLDGHCLHRN